jgi:hypothetical protein
MYSADEVYSDEITSPIERPQAPRVTTFTNRRGDVQAWVDRNQRGLYVVTVKDTDSGETLAVARMYGEYGKAIQYAQQCVEDDEELPL